MKKLLLSLMLMSIINIANAQIINTIAGGGNGDGNLATNVGNYPWGLGLDKDENLLSCDLYGTYIRKINSSGIISSVAGNGAQGFYGDEGLAINAALYAVVGAVCADKKGNIYIADSYNGRIRKISISGIISTIAGGGNSTADGISALSASISPFRIAVDNRGNIYLTDLFNSKIRKIDTAGIITTVAGNGNSGYNGDGIAATSASLNYPDGIAIDSIGNLYICDDGNYRLRKVNPNGTITTIAGNGTSSFSGENILANGASLADLAGVNLDSKGNIYITEAYRVRKINASGIISTIAGQTYDGFSGDGGLATQALLGFASDIIVDKAGNIYIDDYANYRIRKINSAGIINTISGNGSEIYTDPGKLAEKSQIFSHYLAVSKQGDILFSDGLRSIKKITNKGILSTIAGGEDKYGDYGDGGLAINAGVSYPQGLCFDKFNSIYITTTDLNYNYGNRVRKIDNNGIITTIAGTGVAGYNGDGGLAVYSQLNYPTDVDADKNGNIYVADARNNRIRKINSSGTITTIAGTGVAGFSGDGGLAVNARINFPYSVKVDKNGNIYFSDASNGRVRKISSSGIISTVAGGGSIQIIKDGDNANQIYLDFPEGIDLDSIGNIYIALPVTNNQVLKVNQAGIISVLAGTYDQIGFSGDGGNSNKSKLNVPEDVAVDGKGNILISDSYNNRIRKIFISCVKPVITANTSTNNICPNKTVKLTSSALSNNLWNTGATSQTIPVNNSGGYYVTSKDTSGCYATSETTIVTYQSCTKPTGLATSNITKSAAKLNWAADSCAVGYQYEWRKKGTTAWSTGQTTGNSKTITGLTASTTYQWRIIKACRVNPDTLTSGYTNGPEFTTLAVAFLTNTNADNLKATTALQPMLYPNPTKNVATVSVSNAKGMVTIVLSDINGKQLWQSSKISSTTISIPIQNLAAGIYMVQVKDEKESVVVKMVKE